MADRRAGEGVARFRKILRRAVLGHPTALRILLREASKLDSRSAVGRAARRSAGRLYLPAARRVSARADEADGEGAIELRKQANELFFMSVLVRNMESPTTPIGPRSDRSVEAPTSNGREIKPRSQALASS
jgi:hypothetical protein